MQGASSGVAGDAFLVHQQQDRIRIAVDTKIHQTLRLAGAFALAP